VPYWKNRSGAFTSDCGDSKVEESAWNAQLVLLAPVMMPQHSHRSAWAYKGAELAIGSFSHPSNIKSSVNVLGRPLQDWLEGTNIDDDGTLVNHNFYHPDYVSTFSQTLTAGLVQSLAHQPTSQSVVQNTDLAYSGLITKRFSAAPVLPCPTSPAYVAPSADNPMGTDYIPSFSLIYYPEGNDWGTDRRMHFADDDVLARAFNIDDLVSQKGATWEPLHAQRVLDMHARSTDGRTYQAAQEDYYIGREEWVAREAGTAWLAKWAAYKNAISVNNPLQQIVINNHMIGKQQWLATGQQAALPRMAPKSLAQPHVTKPRVLAQATSGSPLV